MNIQSNLKKFGLSNKEAQVYITLIKKVEVSAYALSIETGIPRATLYEILDGMKDQGLVQISRVNGVKMYTAESPNRLIKLIKEKEEAIHQILPNLLALSSKKEVSPSVKLYLGREGVTRVLDDILDTLSVHKDKQLYAIAGTKLHHDHPSTLKSWIVRREKLGIPSKLIAYDYGTGKEPDLYPTNNFRETRLIPPKFAFDTTLDIYADKVAIFSEIDGKEHSLIIESPSISETFKKFHQFMWEHAKPSSGIN